MEILAGIVILIVVLILRIGILYTLGIPGRNSKRMDMLSSKIRPNLSISKLDNIYSIHIHYPLVRMGSIILPIKWVLMEKWH
jgi:hypothetical protein